MLKQILTSSSNNFIYIDNLDLIYKLAATTKANVFYTDPISNKLFGSFDEVYSIIEVDAPFPIKLPFYFMNKVYASAKSKELIDQYKTFFYVEEWPQFLFPENRRADLMNNNIYIDWEDYTLHDNMTGMELMDYLVVYNNEDDPFAMRRFENQLKGFNNISRYLTNPVEFIEAHDMNTINFVMTNKIVEGAQVMTLSTNGKNYTFYVFKALLGPITKADKLSILIRDDLLEPNKFMCTFRVFKKKPKLGIDGIKEIIVDTHTLMLNLS